MTAPEQPHPVGTGAHHSRRRHGEHAPVRAVDGRFHRNAGKPEAAERAPARWESGAAPRPRRPSNQAGFGYAADGVPATESANGVRRRPATRSRRESAGGPPEPGQARKLQAAGATRIRSAGALRVPATTATAGLPATARQSNHDEVRGSSSGVAVRALHSGVAGVQLLQRLALELQIALGGRGLEGAGRGRFTSRTRLIRLGGSVMK